MAANFLKRIGFLTPLAGLTLVLVLVDVLLSLGNQFLRLEVNERQQFITQSIQLEELQREIVAALASVAVKSNDRQLKDLLASMGINLVDPRAAGGAR
ncbi:MAG: hypothetical protein HYV05_14145 [Deltaproteobacteria bacterium]|nr:hypothetical protein [Deltaproteobacteria bacterium]